MLGTSFSPIIRRSRRLYVPLSPVLASITNLVPSFHACSCPQRDTLATKDQRRTTVYSSFALCLSPLVGAAGACGTRTVSFWIKYTIAVSSRAW